MDALLKTGNAVLVEASPLDDIYGAGMKKIDLLNADGTLKNLPQHCIRAMLIGRQRTILGLY